MTFYVVAPLVISAIFGAHIAVAEYLRRQR
jgi:hypothetical protein